MAIQVQSVPGQIPRFQLGLGTRTDQLRYAVVFIFVAAAYYFSAKIGLSLALIHTNVSAVWPPSGLAIAAVLLFGYRIWPAILAGAFLANFFTPVTPVAAAGIAIGNTLEAVAAGALLSRIGFRLTLGRVKDITLLVIAAIACTALSATIGNLTLCVTQAAEWRDFGNLWVTWWLGDTAGALIVTPLLLVWSGATAHRLPPRRYVEAVVVLVLLALTATATFTGSALIPIKYYPLARLTVPFFLYAAFRLGFPGVTLGIAIVSVFAAWGTARGLGPFGGREANDTLLLLQLFAGSNAVTFLFLVAAIEERRSASAALQENQRRLSSNLAVTRILGDSPDLYDAAPRILRTVCETLGWKLGALWTVEPDGSHLQCLDVWSVPGANLERFVAATRARRFAPGEGLPGRVWSTKSPAWIREIGHDDNFPRWPVAAEVGLRSAVSFPLLIRDRCFGTMEFFSSESRERNEAMLSMLAGVGSQIGVFIERRRAETSVRELAAIVESAEDAVMGKDLEGRITSWNAGAQKLFGYRAREVVGREIFMLIPAELHDDERRVLGRLRQGEPVAKFETIRLAKDGTALDVSLAISPVRSAEGMVIGASTIARDITERKLAEKERELILRREQEARAEAEAANRSKDEFLASVSHELRTPLNAIVGWSALLHAGMLDQGNQQQAVEIIDRNAKLQARLIDDLLDVSRIVSGNIRFEPKPVSLPDVIEAAVESVRPSAETKRIVLHLQIEPGAKMVNGDADRLQQVVWNLLTNAVKFTPEEGRIDIDLRSEGQQVEVVITDSGEGITADFLPHVFERFRQADSTTTRRHRGIGIGLAIVHHLVNLHHGTVTAASEGEGKGATFRVILPMLNGQPAIDAKFGSQHVQVERAADTEP
jgi:PAS domain S-box-containing protein